MGHYGIFIEVFVRSPQVLHTVEEVKSCQRGLATMALLVPAEFFPAHVISNVEKASLAQCFERLPAASLIAGVWKRKILSSLSPHLSSCGAGQGTCGS